MDSNIALALELLPLQTLNTLYMVLASTFFSALFGIPLAVLLTLTQNTKLYRFLSMLVNIGRSFPFAILIVALIPFTRLLVGTTLGTTASIVPLTIGAIPFIARLIETNIKEIDPHILEALQVMAAPKKKQILALLDEALPGIYSSFTVLTIHLIGYSAMAGLVGGGGLGEVAIQYGYNRFNTPIMVMTVVLLIFLVQIFQWIGNSLRKALLKKRGLKA